MASIQADNAHDTLVKCGDCGRFLPFETGNSPVEGADGECIIRKIYSHGHPQYSAVNVDDYCSYGARHE